MKILTLKKRQEFVDIANDGLKAVAKGLVLQAIESDREGSGALHIGFTATKRTGNAVARNRIKRRLRVLAAKVMPKHAKWSHDYVIIGRTATIKRDFADLEKDLKFTLHSTGTYKK